MTGHLKKTFIITTYEDEHDSVPCKDLSRPYTAFVCRSFRWKVVAQDFCAHHSVGVTAVTFWRRDQILDDNLWLGSLNDAVTLVSARMSVGWKIAYDMRRLLANGLGSDVVLRFANSTPPVEIAAHKCILAQRSEKFLKMFFGNLPIAHSVAVAVLLVQCEETSIRGFIEFLYTDDLSTALSYDRYWDMMYLAEEYLVPRLKTACEKQLRGLEMNGPSLLRFVTDTTLRGISPALYKQGVEAMSESHILFTTEYELRPHLLKRPSLLLDVLAMGQHSCLAEETSMNGKEDDDYDDDDAAQQSLLVVKKRKMFHQARRAPRVTLDGHFIESGDKEKERTPSLDDLTAEQLLAHVE